MALLRLGVAVGTGPKGPRAGNPAMTAAAAPNSPPAGLLAASVGCRWASDSEDVKYGRHWQCDEGGSDTVSFSFQMHSVNNDHLLVAWGFCASEDACGGDFQNGDCEMQSDELNDNLPHTFDSVAPNEKYKENVACMQVKCDNWVEDCQMTFDSVDMSPR